MRCFRVRVIRIASPHCQCSSNDDPGSCDGITLEPAPTFGYIARSDIGIGTMTDTHLPILHHFEASPFSEKIRVIFGFKNIAWQSVLIPRIMPKPDLVPLTGGYRRTPVMQIGADIFCDTQIIQREIEARFPQPTLFPSGNEGMPWMAGQWIDRIFFGSAVFLVFGSLGDKVPQDFIDDRTKLRGAPFDVKAMAAALPHHRDQFRSHI